MTALDVAASRGDALRIDLTIAAGDTHHADRIADALRAIPDVEVKKVSDRTFLMHLGGVIETASTPVTISFSCRASTTRCCTAVDSTLRASNEYCETMSLSAAEAWF